MTADPPVAEPTADAKAARRAKRWYKDDDTAPATLRSSGVPHEFWPSRTQFTRWSLYLMPELGADDEGWWYARCPIHDPDVSGELSAMIHFTKGSMRCLTNDTTDCHKGKRGMTLVNVVAALRPTMDDDGEDDGGTAAESE